MLYQKLITTSCYVNNKDEIKEIKVPHWHSSFLLNLNSNNFYFYFVLNNKFFNNNATTSSFAEYKNLNIQTYRNYDDFKKMLTISINFNQNDLSFLTDFMYIRNSSFIKFFINNMIDVPICFKKSVSLKNHSFELPLLKFSNFLMKQGKKEKIIRLIFSSFRLFFKNINTNSEKNNSFFFSWFNLYIFGFNLLQTNSLKFNLSSNFKFQELINLKYNNIFLNNDKTVNISFFLKNYLYFLLSKVSPIFSYFIYSVDKNIRKYSRGKSGKYVFIWKFIAPYKRIHLAIRWLIKDIKFNQNKIFNERLLKTFDSLLFSPEKSFSWKSKIFSHNYVFKNFRKNLMTSLRTTS